MFGTTKPQGPDKVQGQEPIIEMNLGVVGRIHNSLLSIATHLKANTVTGSEQRELEFDRDRRHEELLEAFRGMATRMGGEVPNPKAADKHSRVMDLMKWVAKIFGLGIAGFKMFFKKFLKFMNLGLWPILRVAGMILSRLFWPLTIGAAMLWTIPKVIDAWPGMKAMIQNVVSNIWGGIKSLLGIDEEDDDAVAAHMESAEGPPIYYWDTESGNWVIANTVIPGVPQSKEGVIKKLVPFVIGDNFQPEFLPILINSYMGQSVASVPETPMIGDSGFLATPGAAAMAIEAGLDPNLVALIAEQEGFRDTAYQDPAGNWTVGYGHTGAMPTMVDGQMVANVPAGMTTAEFMRQGGGSPVPEGMTTAEFARQGGSVVKADTSMSRRVAAQTLVSDVAAAAGRAERSIDNKFGMGTFASMPKTWQGLATDVSFNVGSIRSMPQLMNAMGTGNAPAVLAQMDRHYTTSTGTKMPLTRRNEAFRGMITTPSIGVPDEEMPEVIVMPTETHATSTVPIVSKSSSKHFTNQQVFYSDPHYAHLGVA